MQKLLLALLLAQSLSLPAVWGESESIKVAGTRVFLSPPEGFAPSDRFSGFIKKDESASIVVSEIKGPYDQIVAGFAPGALASHGMNLTASSVLPAAKGLQGSLIEFTQVVAGQKFKKVACIFGDKSNTTIVTGTMPDAGSGALFNQLRAAAKSARFDAHAKLTSLDEGLSFTIADTKKFKKANRMQNVLLFTTTGKMEQSHDNNAIFAVGQSLGKISTTDHETFARERLNKTPQVKRITVDKINAVKQAGMEGDEFLATAADAQDGTPTFLYQTMLFNADGYYLFQGLCPLAERKVYEPEFQQLVKNFELR